MILSGSGPKRVAIRILARSALRQRAGGQPVGLLVPLQCRQEPHGRHSRAQHLVRGASFVACTSRAATDIDFIQGEQEKPVLLPGTVQQRHPRFSLHAHWVVYRGHE